ncbi:MAG: hypothetical protein U0T82_11555 [Bacteroidales bacterium]
MRSLRTLCMVLVTGCFLLQVSNVSAQKKEKDAAGKSKTTGDTLAGKLGGLKFRGIGPAWASGRIADFAVNPGNPSEYYVGVASGHVWKTTNNGNTFSPVFDNYGAYSIGCVVLDPKNPNVVWVGTGENNHQRALGYGDGVYRSNDGGKSFKNMGLKDSRQIGDIVIDPRNTNVVFVAAEGSVWGPGGDRGLYKSTDGGKNWRKVLDISVNTGVNNIVVDPADPDVLYATSEQRRRHIYSKIGGGPESAVYKSTDNGESWNKCMSGLPSVDIGGMDITVSPVDHNVVYLIMEAALGKGGFFRSVDRGESWDKMSSYNESGQYFNEIFCDPKDVNRLISVGVVTDVTLDGGKTWKALGNNNRHVDDHAVWIDPRDTRHIFIGGDGGMYETFDDGANWIFKSNLPVTQFYRVAVDNELPFYNVYGGTQDNNSMGGPSRNLKQNGVASDEWFITMGGDGFWAAIDPVNTNIVYTEYQYGNMYRYDKRSGEATLIKPRERKGELSYKWNWNTPMLISPHKNTRIYVAANKVFRSENRGDSWEVISDDLTTKTDRNTWPVMDKFWSAEAVAKDLSTSLWGTIVSLAESPLQEGLLYAGTDDGVISVSEDGGKNWRQIKNFPGVPEYTFVSDIWPDRFDVNVVYASFDNLQRDDFKPYILKSSDKGKNWKSISANLPENGTVHTISQDNKNGNLLFLGTEFGFFFSVNAGEIWTQLKSGLPVIPVRDIAIQEREGDLVLATFGRGFYILDDYSPLRVLSSDLLQKDAFLFPVREALSYTRQDSRDNQGSLYYFAPNPDYGATFTWYLKTAPKTITDLRREKEKELFKAGKPIPQPGWRDLEIEKNREEPHLIFSVKDEWGNMVRELRSSPSEGLNRSTWDLRYTRYAPVGTIDKFSPVESGNAGVPALPGKYSVSMSLWNDGVLKEIAGPVEIRVRALNNVSLPAADQKEVADFSREVSRLSGNVEGANRMLNELIKRVETIRKALYQTPGAPVLLSDKARALAVSLDEINFKLNGVPAKASSEETPPDQVPVAARLDNIAYIRYSCNSAVTGTEREQLAIVKDEFPGLLNALKKIALEDIPALEAEMDKAGVPYTPGRIPAI